MAAVFSILDKRECPKLDGPRAAFYLDLNLNQIIDRIGVLWGSDARKFYYYFPMDKDCQEYRRQVYRDVKKPQISAALCDFIEAAKGMEEAGKQREAVLSPLQKHYWQLMEIEAYCHAFDGLGQALEDEALQSEGMQQLRTLLKEYLTQDAYLSMRDRVRDLLAKVAGFRFVITYDRDRMIISEGEAAGDYEGFIERFGDPERASFRTPFLSNPSLSNLEQECLEILLKKKPEIFKSIQELAEEYQGYAKEELLRFRKEIVFYLSFHTFEQEMMGRGYSFATPTCDEAVNMQAQGLYDLALACAAIHEERQVVCNDMEYLEKESFFVLTGPNQGGKTTFARSLGQMIYFTKMGLDVPAVSANVHYFRDILTHFSVEESVETGRGKLKEELVRLAPMMTEVCRNSFVVINELFTTAATYDAEIMGRKVLTHFIDQGCRGIYVTHLKELTTVHEKVVSLRAMLNEQKLQSFKIQRSEAEESACAANQVNKHRLTYSQLKERL